MILVLSTLINVQILISIDFITEAFKEDVKFNIF
jgi:hypothetical protein